LFHPDMQQKPGALVASPPWIVLSAGASAEQIGATVNAVLAESRPQIAAVDMSAVLRDRYNALNVSSENELMTGAQLVALKRCGGFVYVTPTENGSNLWHQSFLHLTQQQIRVAEGAGERAIGEAILRGWDSCRSP
jgi:hypothetical protein